MPKKEYQFTLTPAKIIIGIFVLLGLTGGGGYMVMCSNASAMKQDFQNTFIKPVVEREFERLIKPYKTDQDTLIYNSKITIKMLQITLGDSTGSVLKRAIDEVENPNIFIRKHRRRRQ